MERMDMLEGWRIARVLPLVRGRLLDIGCGFNNLVHAYGQGVGADVHPWPGIQVLFDPAARLPFPDATFDTVTILAALNHITNRPATLRETQRVLRPSGQLIITMIGPRTGILAHWLFVRDERARGGMRPGEKPGMTWAEVRGLFHETGFAVARELPFQAGLNRVFVGVKREGN